MTARVLRGHLFHVAGDARLADAAASLVSIRDGALVVDAGGRIAWTGPYAALPAAYADLAVTRADFLLPGFVDTHLHYPQVHATAAYGGGRLLHWLDHCIFPTEARLADETVAARAAAEFVARRVAVGTTSALVFGSAFPAAQDALFQAHADAGLRLVSGRGVQTVGPASAEPLLTSEDAALTLVADEIDRWHGREADLSRAEDPSRALLQVAVVPRFALSVTRQTLRGLGALYADVRDRGVYFHTHLSENAAPDGGEVAAGPLAVRGRELPRHLRRPLPTRLPDRRRDPARPAEHLRPRRALHRRRARAAGRDPELDRPLPHLAAVPRLRNPAVAADDRGRRDRRRRVRHRRR